MNKSLNVIIEETKNQIVTTVNQIIHNSGLPAYLVEPIILSLLSDIREVKLIELTKDYEALAEELSKKESNEEKEESDE